MERMLYAYALIIQRNLNHVNVRRTKSRIWKKRRFNAFQRIFHLVVRTRSMSIWKEEMTVNVMRRISTISSIMVVLFAIQLIIKLALVYKIFLAKNIMNIHQVLILLVFSRNALIKPLLTKLAIVPIPPRESQ